MFSILVPLALVKTAVIVNVGASTLLLVSDVFALIHASFWKNECAEAFLFVVTKLARVEIATWKAHLAVAMHLVTLPIALVHSSISEPSSSITMAHPTPCVTLIFKLRCDAFQGDQRRLESYLWCYLWERGLSYCFM